MSVTKQEHYRALLNSQLEVTARLEAVVTKHKDYSVTQLCQEIDKVIERVRHIKHSLIFIKNVDNG